jgi:hypothetical protein
MVHAPRSSLLTIWALRSALRPFLSLSTAMPERDRVGVRPAAWIGGDA